MTVRLTIRYTGVAGVRQYVLGGVVAITSDDSTLKLHVYGKNYTFPRMAISEIELDDNPGGL